MPHVPGQGSGAAQTSDDAIPIDLNKDETLEASNVNWERFRERGPGFLPHAEKGTRFQACSVFHDTLAKVANVSQARLTRSW